MPPHFTQRERWHPNWPTGHDVVGLLAPSLTSPFLVLLLLYGLAPLLEHSLVPTQRPLPGSSLCVDCSSKHLNGFFPHPLASLPSNTKYHLLSESPGRPVKPAGNCPQDSLPFLPCFAVFSAIYHHPTDYLIYRLTICSIYCLGSVSLH